MNTLIFIAALASALAWICCAVDLHDPFSYAMAEISFAIAWLFAGEYKPDAQANLHDLWKGGTK